MNQFYVLHALSLVVFLVCNVIWYGLITRGFYQGQLAPLFGPINWVAVGLYYPLYIIGLTFFVLQPAVLASSWRLALVSGALFGFFTSLKYGLNNMATLKGWAWSVVCMDVMWGTVAVSLTAAVTVYLYLKTK